MTNMLEILMRLKNVKNLDPRHSTLVENAYYLCKPPERSARVNKVRPPLQQYIRKLLFSDLDKSSAEHVLRQLRKLPWDECEEYILKCFMKVHKGKYSQVHLIALLTAGLSRYHNEFAVAVVDELAIRIDQDKAASSQPLSSRGAGCLPFPLPCVFSVFLVQLAVPVPVVPVPIPLFRLPVLAFGSSPGCLRFLPWMLVTPVLALLFPPLAMFPAAAFSLFL
ncbi:hypothetical protein M5K25_005865 [Dendrobium thyrsiflorum]|uniref:MIF4G domain-containing protein n=1 Tax=Dendrobium thyrsiflorum TaxID=117978 RepID=A0ABD0V9Z1_DENTH